ncbi:endolytic transglycosylase MltG [uncultured Thiodictyon sp.]|uniref:endolytic transglycosylase MltG n=1 Tax=uncultured Thiodictyon sp. TaxID=1846217 RepID=UPI0025DEDAB7|nr:endolytic transglycosylase MltG [uncultured Thiodictyon sp.]
MRSALAALLLGVGILAGGVWLDYQRFIAAPVRISEPTVVFEVQRGNGARQIADALTARGFIRHPYYLLLLAHQRRDGARFKAGEFELTQGMTPGAVLDRLVSGRVIQYPITVVEGWTFRQAVAAILADGHFGDDLAAATDESLMAALGHPGKHPEGRFFPDTYSFPRHTTGVDVLRRALQRMDQVLAGEWDGRATGLPLKTPYEALILASIIEKETGLAAERPEIGGVFVRRLNAGMRLQTDPTVIYGMGERFDGNLRRADLREATPYNTYVITGLPPTPIALPGRAAIHAALHPAAGDSLYFVARGDGGHVFSATLEQHNRAVREYQLHKAPSQPGP